MDENIAKWLPFVAIIVLVAIISGVLFLLSEAKFRGWEEGRQENERYHRHTVDVLSGRIKSRECALAMYRDISTTLCDDIPDCTYCPYERDKQSHRCALWDLNENVGRFGIKEVHVGTKHDGVERPTDVCKPYERREGGACTERT